MINIRRQNHVFGRGTTSFVDLNNRHLLAYYRENNNQKIMVINNLSHQPQQVNTNIPENREVLFQNNVETAEDKTLLLQSRGFVWIKV
jgi:glycosidase